MPRANESDVWKYMLKLDGKAKCNLCNSEISTAGSSTTALRNHLSTKHPSVYSVGASRSPSLGTFGFGPAKPCSESRQEKITELLARIIIANVLPISFVESEEVIQLFDYIEPNYKVPKRETMTKRLDFMKEKLASEVKKELEDSAAAVCITTDIWTSMANDAYLSLTASYITPDWVMKTPTLADAEITERHTMAVISTKLDNLADTWGIKDKVLVCVHDGASNMAQTSATNAWLDVGCSAHKLHLSVTSALGIDEVTNSALSKLVGASSRLVGHFSHSVLATNELEKKEVSMNMNPPVKLIQHVKTRWNSVYDMLNRLHKLRYVYSYIYTIFVAHCLDLKILCRYSTTISAIFSLYY